MTRIFNTDTVNEMLFNCVSVLVSGMSAAWCHASVPAGYGSIFISHSTFSFIVTLLMPADAYSSGHLMPALVCV